MTKKIKQALVRALEVLGLLLAVLVVGFQPAWALPQMPHQCYGSVTINGSPAASGVIVSARIGGVEYASTATDSQGRYGYSPSLFMVPADDPDTTTKEGGSPGDTLRFYIAGLPAATETFGYGQVTNLNLDVSLRPPLVSTVIATTVTASTATLKGNLISLGTAATASVSFDYGTTTAYGESTLLQTMAAAGAFGANVIGLAPATTYYFRAKADGGIHGISVGADMTLTTLATPGISGEPEPTPTPVPTPTPSPIPTPAPSLSPTTIPAPTSTPMPVPTPALAPETAPMPTPQSPPTPTLTAAPAPAPPASMPPSAPLPAQGKTLPVESSSWALTMVKLLSVLVAGLIIYFVVVRRWRRPAKVSKNRRIKLLHIKADRLKKDINAKWKQILSGKATPSGLNHGHLVTKYYFLTEIACLIGTYYRLMQNKSLQMDDDEVQSYEKLIDWVRKMMGSGPEILG